jgi:prepilin-type N-terminal cleavage/methylation domain-containing protein
MTRLDSDSRRLDCSRVERRVDVPFVSGRYSSERGSSRSGFSARADLSARGFTLVELMVVMAILAAAAGFMAPEVTKFLRNRAVDSARQELTSVLQRARYLSISQNRDLQVVFFREGGRIFDPANKAFVDSDWSPEASPLAQSRSRLLYVLGCCRDLASNDKGFDDPDNPDYEPATRPYIPPFAWWEEKQRSIRSQYNSGGEARSDLQYEVAGLASVFFRRDGTMEFGEGASDVRSVEFRKKIPETADLVVYQIGNTAACFVDFQLTGTAKSKIVALESEFFELASGAGSTKN